jgi:hypothetical protein
MLLLKDEHSDQLKKLNKMEKAILDAIIQNTDLFSALHKSQINLHRETQLVVERAIERDGTKIREIIQRSRISTHHPLIFYSAVF